jgi:hypothetical protein
VEGQVKMDWIGEILLALAAAILIAVFMWSLLAMFNMFSQCWLDASKCWFVPSLG